MKSQSKYLILMLLLLSVAPLNYSSAAGLATRLKGKILLQIESKGEAWYVNPGDEKRHFLGRPDDAFSLMRRLGVGITNNDLRKIQIADANLLGSDSDGDGLSDMLEDSLGTDKNKADSDGDGYSDKGEIIGGYNPLGSGKNIDNNFTKKQLGKILLQVEQNGEAWYVNPNDSKRYFLGRPVDAFNTMRKVGLGISNKDISMITSANQEANSSTGAPISDNENLLKYSSSDYGFTLSYPKAYQKQEGFMGTSLFLKTPLRSKEDMFQENFSVMVEDLSSHPLTLEEYVAISTSQLNQLITDIDIISSEQDTLSDNSAHKIVYTGVQGQHFIKWMQVLTMLNDKAYTLTFTSSVDQYDFYINDISAIVDSFRIVK